MSKIARLKEWLTPAEAARQLFVSLREPCTAADVLRIGLNGRLVLSVRFSSPIQLLRSSGASTSGKTRKGPPPSQAAERHFSRPADIWDLPLTGSERAAVEMRCQQLMGNRQVAVLPRLPAYVRGRNGDTWQLPSPGLPPDCEIIVRSEALAELEAREAAPPEADERTLGMRERRTLLTVIAAVCSLDKIDPAERGAAKKIIGAAELLGIKISASAISRILNEIPEAVETRRS